MRNWVRWLPKETAPAELAEAFQMRLERTMLLDEVDKNAGRPPMRLNRWPQFRAAAAVAVLALGLGAVVFFALPPRHSPFTAAPPATRPSKTIVAWGSIPTTDDSKLADSADREKLAETRESEVAERLKDARLGGSRSAEMPATAPAETALAKGLLDDGVPSVPLGSAGRAVGTPLPSGPAATQPALADVGKKAAEPAAQLTRIASTTYNLMSQDPTLIELLRNSNSDSASLALPGKAPASFGAAPGPARADKAADQPQSPLASSLRTEAAPASQAGHPFVMVVLATDTDRARKQIGDYLADNGIETRVFNDAYGRRVPDATTVAARARGTAAPPAIASTPGPSAPAAASAEPAALAPAGAATPTAPTAAPEAAGRLPFAPARLQPRAAEQRLQSPPAAPAAPAPAPAPTAVPEIDHESLAAKEAAPAGSLLSDPEAHENIFIARRMTARQARELQANLRQPAAFQWAAVYCQPTDGSNPPRQLGEVQPQGLGRGRAAAQSPSTQPLGRLDALREKDQAPRRNLAEGEAPAGGKPADLAADRNTFRFAAKLPATEPQPPARTPATTRQAEMALAAASPATRPPAPVAAPAAAGGAGGAGLGQDIDRAMLRSRRDNPATIPSGPPLMQPGRPQPAEQAAGPSTDDRPVTSSSCCSSRRRPRRGRQRSKGRRFKGTWTRECQRVASRSGKRPVAALRHLQRHFIFVRA